ncbi:hypothetical protein VNO77_21688 [Canavalia gladiata]|uniref:Uncharacterized protein n=1 Tax=Canavalia gladiata TaxID=3824 RepID=A0AAN9QMD0_CANGL
MDFSGTLIPLALGRSRRGITLKSHKATQQLSHATCKSSRFEGKKNEARGGHGQVTECGRIATYCGARIHCVSTHSGFRMKKFKNKEMGKAPGFRELDGKWFWDKTGDWFPVLVLGLWAVLMKEESIKANGFGVPFASN